jgi:hypothetical protein
VNTLDIQKEFGNLFPWHYNAMDKSINDCPSLGTVNFDYKSLSEHVMKLCESQNPKTNGKGFGYYFENGNIKQSLIDSRDEKFRKLFNTWIKSNWTLENSCFYEFHDEELGDFYQPLINAYQEKFGYIKHKQLRVFIKPPMTAIGLHADTYGTFCRKHGCDINEVFRALTLVGDWQWGHYVLVGNEVCHQYREGDSVKINPNVFHCVGNIGFNPLITMNITGVLENGNSI